MTAALPTPPPALDALADGTRRSILEVLCDGPRSVRELADELPVTRSAVSQHLRVLKEARLVADRPVGTRRIYSVAPEGFAAAQAYLDAFWRQALATLKAVAEADAATATDVANPAGGGAAGLAVAEFGFPGPLRDRLVGLVLAGVKTTTTGLYEEHRREGSQLPRAGERQLVVDSAGRGVAVLETIEVEVRRLADVDLQFAVDEGEGFDTLEAWRAAHVGFFTSPEMVAALGDPPVEIGDDTLVVCERFRVVERR